MSSSVRATALEALHNLLLATFASGPNPALVLRGEPLPQRLPGRVVVAMDDGEIVEARAIISPLQWAVEHEVEVTIAVTGETPQARTSALEAAIAQIASAIATNRTLGGAVEWCEVTGYSTDEIDADAGYPLKAIRIEITMFYTSPETII